MPTAKDRIQVLLDGLPYARIMQMASEERRSAANMCAVLLDEAINKRIREGLYVPDPEHPMFQAAIERQEERRRHM